MLPRLSRFRYPLPEYIDIFRAIEDAIYEGYLYKNPLTPTGQHFLHYMDSEETRVQPCTGFFQPTGRGLSVFGESGAGKTAIIEAALSKFPQIITHTEFEGQHFTAEQVTWLKIDCPSSATVWGYVTHVLDELDRIFGTTEFGSGPVPRNIPQAGNAVERRLRSLHLGCLVLDELQNLKVGNAEFRRQLLNVLLHLINRSGIPVVFCGNQDTKDLLAETLRNARRAEDGGCFEIEMIDPAIWPIFVERLWAHQFTDIVTPLTDALSRTLFQLSKGLPKFAVNIYREAQKTVIGTGDESLTVDVLSEAYLAACGLSRQILETLPTPTLASHVVDLDRSAASESEEEPKTSSSPEQSDSRAVASANRVQHPELSTRLCLVRQNGYTLPLNVDPDILRSAGSTKDPYEHLLSQNVILTELFTDEPLS